MKPLRIVSMFALLLFPSLLSAQFRVRPVASLDTVRCTSGELENKSIRVTDGLSAIDCSVGGGGYAVDCVCDEGIYRPSNVSAVDGSQFFASLGGSDSSQSIQGQVGPNQPRLVLTGSTATLFGDGATPAFVRAAETAASLEPNGGNFYVIASELGVRIGVGGGSEVSMDAARMSVPLPLAIPSTGSLPTCDTTIAPIGRAALMYDTTGPDLCICVNGTGWVPADGTGTCV